MWIELLAFFGGLGLIVLACGCVVIFIEWLKDRIWDLRRKWQYKHRFDKKPIAKCYCIDCREYDEYKELCRFNSVHVLDNDFCCWGKPDMSKMPNIKED